MKSLEIVIGVALLLIIIGCDIHADTAIELKTHCPPGFELTDSAGCRLRSMYQLYASLQGAGVGGLKTGLPSIRDGFSPQQIDLGRYLFFDPLLSGNNRISCASCHHPELGFSDGLGRSVGATGEEVARSAPGLWNVGFLKILFWDGRAGSLESQATGPLYAKHEMGNTPEQLINSLNSSRPYRDLFRTAFPQAVGDISLDQVYTALAAFEASLVSLNSPYDQYAHGYHQALSEEEIEGLNVFRSFVARCSECHTPPLFTNQELAVIGTPEHEGRPFDPGEAGVTHDASQRGAFKVPSLRNIALTAPYMHSGRFPTLKEAVRFYSGGRGHAVPPGENLHLHWHIWDPQLSDLENDRLVSFLHALTDTSFIPEIPDRVPSGLKPVGRLPEGENP